MNKPRGTHTSFYKGSKIRLIMRDGTIIIAKFIEKHGKKLLRTDRGDFRVADIRAANSYKPLAHELH